jgi:hypothetical protein
LLSPLLFLIAYDLLLVFLSSFPTIRSFAFADDLALTSPSVSAIYPALSLVSEFSLVSGLGINKDKSAVVPASSPKKFAQIRLELKASPWPDLPLKDSGTHLGILIGRDVSLEDIWGSPMSKALAKLKTNKNLIHALPLSSRFLFVNVFIVSLFSYHALFFILPTDLWKKIKSAISRTIIPFNGGAFTYSSLVCAKKIFSVKPSLKDVWAFNISLLAVRSKFFSPTINYHQLPTIKVKHNMHITDHRVRGRWTSGVFAIFLMVLFSPPPPLSPLALRSTKF